MPEGGDFTFVVCSPRCVCWPDGEFTSLDQGILECLASLLNTTPEDLGRDPLVECVVYFLRKFAKAMTPRRLAHLMAVPLLSVGTALTFTGGVAALMAEFGISGDTVVAILQTLPLCPEIGSGDCSWGWRKTMPRQCHPGRPPGGLSLRHLAARQPMWAVVVCKAYPLCGCQWKCAHLDAAAPPHAVGQWRRWHARDAKSRWVLACCHA